MDQVAGLEAQEAALAATGCTKLFAEQASSVGQCDQLDAALDFVREGDTLVVARLDRLARSTADLLGIVELLEGKKVGLRILDFGGSEVDTRGPTGRKRRERISRHDERNAILHELKTLEQYVRPLREAFGRDSDRP